MLTSKGEPGGADAWNILAHLWQLLQAILDDSAPDLERAGLTSKGMFLLAAVGEHPFPAELAKKMHLPPPTVSYLIKQLESGGFLERRPEPGDLRKFRLVATEAGLGAIERGREAMEQALRLRMARLGPADVAAFDRLVARLARPTGD